MTQLAVASSALHGGPMLPLLMVRVGILTTVIEMHHDFDPDVRSDTIHPSTMEILDELGLADHVLSFAATLHNFLHKSQTLAADSRNHWRCLRYSLVR